MACPLAFPTFPEVEIIAHRGASFEAPENTLGAIRLGWVQTSTVEVDIQLTRDGKIVVIHDSDTLRTTGVMKKIGETNLAELKALDAGSWKDTRYFQERIPTLDEVLAAMPDERRLLIEIKSEAGIVPKLQAALARSGARADRCTVISFDLPALARMKKECPGCRGFGLIGAPQLESSTGRLLPSPHEIIAGAKAANWDGIDLHWRWAFQDNFVQELKHAGLKVYAWTVDDADVARRLVEAGIDGITTDRPAWLRDQLRNSAAR